MFKAEVIQVIRTDLEKRGTGVDGDPIRRVTQYWSLDGNLLWEEDAYANGLADGNFKRSYDPA